MKKFELTPSSRLLCANSGASTSAPACTNTGTLACSKCMLVKYCGKTCQLAHWSKHRQDCRHPQLRADWQPAWVTENRSPAFVNEGPPNVAFGRSANQNATYVWGNVTAIDCLNVARNEGSAARNADFKLCFAASGDIRNMVETINGLPSDYSGKCDILFNDMNPIVVNRNWIILYTLLQRTVPIPGAADLAAHFMYSAALSPVASAHLNQCISTLYGTGIIRDGQTFATGSLHMRGDSEGALHMRAKTEEMKDFLRMPLSTYKFEDAMKSMRSAMLHPSRVDYRDRVLASLTPGHRMAWTHYQQTGVLGPYSADTMHLTEPNRLLFAADGEWLTLDNANPLHGWDVSAVLASGQRHGINPQDIYGCLFFYVKDEFEEFARRIERFNINIHLTQLDARVVSKMIPEGFIKPFSSGCFDRIETSNLADYIGPADVIDCWAPLLNRHNKHATLLMYFMNWHAHQPGARFEDQAGNAQKSLHVMEKTAAALVGAGKAGMNSAAFFRAMLHTNIFLDNSAPFEKFLRDNAEDKARSCGLRIRKRNKIHTRRFGIPLSKQQIKVPEITPEEFYSIYILGGADGPVRFVEFEACP
ncbi:hypothetical protein FIBSPDRAFT_760468 [Athelia psychrophila]|uniref:MYND-type domain-containing protein n=1 Tax=Athelia psychrophila TaxID=1759441 RepID=A0A165Y1G8_9AGAM|nr:hypothetical protein FIBSPDRAFT_760468 [Fibularhizoctonia sp. CBS 109695]